MTDDAETLLTFFDYPALRHEALGNRTEVRDRRRRAVAAA